MEASVLTEEAFLSYSLDYEEIHLQSFSSQCYPSLHFDLSRQKQLHKSASHLASPGHLPWVF